MSLTQFRLLYDLVSQLLQSYFLVLPSLKVYVPVLKKDPRIGQIRPSWGRHRDQQQQQNINLDRGLLPSRLVRFHDPAVCTFKAEGQSLGLPLPSWGRD